MVDHPPESRIEHTLDIHAERPYIRQGLTSGFRAGRAVGLSSDTKRGKGEICDLLL